MTKRRVATYPDPVLREKCEKVTAFDQDLVDLVEDMKETMYKDIGIGLAAPQVSVKKRIVVIDTSEDGSKPVALINPEIIEKSGEIRSDEGCLSIPGFRDSVTRSRKILVRAQDEYGKEFEIEAEELLSCCLQHEIDHLDGILFIDHLSRIKKEMFKRWLKKQEAEAAA